jgi:hypothetical protein
MSTQTITIQIDSRSAAILQSLKEKAESEGVALDVLLRRLAEGVPVLQNAMMTPAEKAEDFLAWVATHSVTGTIADDTRESIYGREDELFPPVQSTKANSLRLKMARARLGSP